uniref:Uncharacterized protein n=1 Tax=Ciona savignyi TaxID=51511 RepID=H2YJE3_CIOSA
MLRGNERETCQSIVLLLQDSDLYSLFQTVTNKKIYASSNEEAVAAILDYSASIEELLSRKKVKRDVLFDYLHQKGERLSTATDKETLILHIKSLCNKGKMKIPAKQHIIPGNATSLNQERTSCAAPCPSAVKIQITNERLSQEFVTWFYPMLNAQRSNKSAYDWKPDHFTPDCFLECSNGVDTVERHIGGLVTHDKFMEMVCRDNVIFNVNSTPTGHRACINEYGMAKVAACGTVHRYITESQSTLVGIFEQLFGLIRDPD